MTVTKRLVKLVFTLFGLVLWVVSVVSAVWVLCSPPEGPDGNLSSGQVAAILPGVLCTLVGSALFGVWLVEHGIPAAFDWYDRLPDK